MASVPGQRGSQLLHLLNSPPVHSPQRFHGKGKENNALVPASLRSSVDLLLHRLVKGTACLGSCSRHVRGCEGVCDGDVQGCILATAPVRRKMSPGRATLPGSRFFSSRTGPSAALAAVSKRISRRRLCLAMQSPVMAHPKAWGPITSFCCLQRGQSPSAEKRGIPRHVINNHAPKVNDIPT